MRRPGSPDPRDRFDLPPHQPDPVVDARAAFEAVCGRLAQAKEGRRQARAAIEAAKLSDRERCALEFAAGKSPAPEDLTRDERQARAVLATVEETLPALRDAVDDLGNQLAAAIVEHRDEWRRNLEEGGADAESRFADMIAGALQALDEIRPVRSAVAWLDAFDLTDARLGAQGQFPGGRLHIKVATVDGSTREADPREVLEALRSAMTTMVGAAA